MTSRILPLFMALLAGCAVPAGAPVEAPPTLPTSARGTVGVLVMAHGGDEEWNRSVAEAVEPLAARVPTAVALGMADPLSLEDGLDALEAEGAEKVAVVRLFLSGESFSAQTDYLLGLSEAPPRHFVLMGAARDLGPVPAPVRHGLSVATHSTGVMNSPEADEILASRALARSTEPGRESVLLVAHGMGDDAANDRVLEAMRRAADGLASAGFGGVHVATLREDWAEKRAVAEGEIRSYVQDHSEVGRTVIVVPYRLSGFGPYAEVLEGLDYVRADGLLPHPRISDWIERTATEIICEEGWGEVLSPCPRVATPSPAGAR